MKDMRFSRRKLIVKITALWGVMAYGIADMYQSFIVKYWLCLRSLNFISDQTIHIIFSKITACIYHITLCQLGNPRHNAA
jgi:hypothetical protein